MKETRHNAAPALEFRESSDGTGFTLSGYACMFGAEYDVNDYLGSYRESIRSGAFTKALAENDDCRLLINHDGLPLARTKSGTLRLTQDDIGLRVEADLDPLNPRVQELRSVMARGDADQMSFAFQATRQSWNKDYTKREISETKLFDVSAVTYPASPTTSMAMRNDEGELVDARMIAALENAFKSVRAGGSIDSATRDLLLQALGAADAGVEAVCDALEVVEVALGLGETDDFSDVAEITDVSEGDGMRAAWLRLRTAALDL